MMPHASSTVCLRWGQCVCTYKCDRQYKTAEDAPQILKDVIEKSKCMVTHRSIRKRARCSGLQISLPLVNQPCPLPIHAKALSNYTSVAWLHPLLRDMFLNMKECHMPCHLITTAPRFTEYFRQDSDWYNWVQYM